MTAPVRAAPVLITVLAHNEEARIAACLASLPLNQPDMAVHVVVNGSRDRTAAIARGFAGVTVHEWAQGGKSRSWSRFILDCCPAGIGTYVLVDGDAQVAPGAIAALVGALAENRHANAASAMPGNGRRAAAYRAEMLRDHGLFGDLYALRGGFVDRMRAAAIRLPDDCIGDDGLIAAMAKTDLADESAWDDTRVMPCPGATFLCEPVQLTDRASWVMQYRRMRSYSLRHFQNRIISAVMRQHGPAGLPRQLASLYGPWLPRLRARRDPRWWWFDRQALAIMREQAAAWAQAQAQAATPAQPG